ncbi:hypothetical protein AB7C87_16155 [Natrarchaeobius sp. A-rgal3]|uniref:hypothetical protein n=1 Tax=Natrarchaeobius versutus TaxID=1679078 RepID=UPI00350F4A52
MVATNSLSALESDPDPISNVREQTFPAGVETHVERYERIVGDRDRELWQWLYRVFPGITLSAVDSEGVRRVRNAKLLASIYITVVDDVAERYGDRATFEELAKVPFERRRPNPDHPNVDGDRVRFAIDLWDGFRTVYEGLPRADEFADLLQFDLEQSLSAIEYSYLLNRYPTLGTERELWAYDVHNMLVFVYADLDLAAAPSFDECELAPLRRLCWRTQRMARISNWISSWKRELGERDYSSGVVTRALETGIVSSEDIARIEREPTAATVEPVVRAIEESGVEASLLERWRSEYREAKRFDDDLSSLDVDAYLDGFETILRSHVARRGN